jgi:hypothetical protein
MSYIVLENRVVTNGMLNSWRYINIDNKMGRNGVIYPYELGWYFTLMNVETEEIITTDKNSILFTKDILGFCQDGFSWVIIKLKKSGWDFLSRVDDIQLHRGNYPSPNKKKLHSIGESTLYKDSNDFILETICPLRNIDDFGLFWIGSTRNYYGSYGTSSYFSLIDVYVKYLEPYYKILLENHAKSITICIEDCKYGDRDIVELPISESIIRYCTKYKMMG